jgi:hypothetical protein
MRTAPPLAALLPVALGLLCAGCSGENKLQQKDGRFTPLKDYGQQVEMSVIDYLPRPFDLGRSEARKDVARQPDRQPTDGPSKVPDQSGPAPDSGCKQGWDDCSSGTCCSPLSCCTCTCGKFCKGSTTLSCNNTCINVC